MVGQWSVVATGRAGAGLMLATLVLVNVGWSATRGGFRVRVGGTTLWGSSPHSQHGELNTPGLDRQPTQTGSLPGRPHIDSDERRVVDGLRQRPAAQPLPAPGPPLPAPAPPVQTLTQSAKQPPAAPAPKRGWTGPPGDDGTNVAVEIAAGLLNPDEVPVQQRTRHTCNDDMGQKKRFAVQTTVGHGVPYHRTNAGLRKAKEVAEKIAVNIAGRKTVIVVSVNAGYFDFARNLMCSIKAHDTTRRPKMILFAVDQQVGPLISEAAAAGGHYVFDIPPEGYAELPSGPSGQTNQDYGTANFEWIMLQRTRLISDLLHLGYDVLGGDADEVWMTNPLDHIAVNYATATEDMLAQPEADGRSCMGFALFRNTPGMKALWALLLQNQECLVWQCFQNKVTKLFGDLGDQMIMKHIMGAVKPKTRNFHAEQFPWGSKFFDPKRSKNKIRGASDMPIVVHNNYVIGKAKKMQRFRDFRVWLLTKDNECRVDKGSDAEAVKADGPAKWYPMTPA